MAETDPILGTSPVAGIAEPHQSTVDYILCAVEQGLFTAAEADVLIDRIRAVRPPPSSVPDLEPMIILGRGWTNPDRLARGTKDTDAPIEGMGS